MSEPEIDPKLAFTVATVWRDARISCPHPHLLQSWMQGGLDGGARAFLDFHLQESKCPYCNAVVEELRARESAAQAPAMADLRDRLLRSTVEALRKTRA